MIILPCDLYLLTVYKKDCQTIPYGNTEGQYVNNSVVYMYAVSEHRKMTSLINKVADWPPNNYKTDTPSFKDAIAFYVCCICDPVISVRVLRLLHNNSVDYS